MMILLPLLMLRPNLRLATASFANDLSAAIR
jgi:hypothetical protein